MKTIYLKAEVVEDDGNFDCRIHIGNRIILIKKEDLEKAQVLAVGEVLKHTVENPDLEIAFEKGEIFYLTNKENKLTLSELTELVRGKERTLEDELSDFADCILKAANKPEIEKQKIIAEWQTKFEQLLKNRE